MNDRVPSFRSDRAAEWFVETADLSDYDLSGAELVQFEFDPKTNRLARTTLRPET